MTFGWEGLGWGSSDDDDSQQGNNVGCAVVLVGVATALIVGLVVVLIGWIFRSPATVPADVLARIDTLEQKTPTLTAELTLVSNELTAIKTTLANLASVPPEAQLKASLDSLTARVEGVDKRVSVVEAGVQNNPEKLLVVPLLRKDLELLTTQVNDIKATVQGFQNAAIAAVSALGTLVLGALGWIIKGYFSSKGRTAKRRPEGRPGVQATDSAAKSS